MINVIDLAPGLWLEQQAGTPWWITRSEYTFALNWDGTVHRLTVPAGFRYDRASIPWEGIISKDSLGCKSPLLHDIPYRYNGLLWERPPDINRSGQQQREPMPWIYPWRRFDRRDADDGFLSCMLADGVSSWRAWVAWAMVRAVARRW